MATILNVEKSEYMNSMIGIYTKNKIGQYSKFLEKNPIFVTYYHINQPLSRQDVGTGSIESELGERSPIRFNKILKFPIYNIPELKPDLVYDETGVDIEMDCSDLVLLPGTIKPRSGDYFLVSFPGIKEFLFRVNNFKYNTIQSNDFYMIDADIKRIGINLEATYMKNQVAETFLTVFENIGTEDRCFVRTTDIDYLNDIAILTDTLKEYYMNAFYNRDLNSFIIHSGKYSEEGNAIYLMDLYLEAFINRANLYYDPYTEASLVLTPGDIPQDNFDMIFNQTLFSALLTRNTDFLRPFSYVYPQTNSSPYSMARLSNMETESLWLFNYKEKPPIQDPPPEETGEQWYDFNPLPSMVPTWIPYHNREYFSSDFLSAILSGTLETDDYLQLIVFNYLHKIGMEIDRKFIIETLEQDEHTFYYLPLVIYCIGQLRSDYYKSEADL